MFTILPVLAPNYKTICKMCGIFDIAEEYANNAQYGLTKSGLKA